MKRKGTSVISSISEDLDTPSSRLVYLRLLTRLKRAQFSKLLGISYDSLKYWETPQNTISLKYARIISEKANAVGICCDANWLMYGKGHKPFLRITTSQENDQDTSIIREIEFFKELHEGAEVLLISDDAMAPYYLPGCYVAGIKKFGPDIVHKALEKTCITETQNGLRLLRKIFPGDSKNQYHLRSLNLASYASHQSILNVELLYAAPVVWHRMRED